MKSTQSNSKQTRDFFDGYAAGFDDIYGDDKGIFWSLVNKYLRSSMRLRYELTINACQPAKGKTILDVGCGPGHYALALASYGADNIIGIDFAPAMIEIAQMRALAVGLEDRTEFIQADFFEFDYPSRFDHLILMGFMDYMPDPARVIKKALDLTDKSAFFSFPVNKGFLAYQRKLRYKSRCPLYLYSYDAVLELFKAHNDFRFVIRKISRDFWVSAFRIS